MIVSYSQSRFGSLVTVRVTSGLVGSPIYYHWYADGLYLGATVVAERSFHLGADEQLEIVVQDTLDAAFDPVLYAPIGWPARRTLWWVRSLGTDVDYYRIDQKAGAGAWTEIGRVAHDDARWDYSMMTPRLTDLTSYQWRVVPVDAADNDGTAVTLAAEQVVRRPDAPNFTATFDPDTAKVLFEAA